MKPYCLILGLIVVLPFYFHQGMCAEGDSKGHGGDLIVCKNKMELLDFYEAVTFLGVTLQLKEISGDYKSKALWAINRLKPFSPGLYEKYRNLIENFEKYSHITNSFLQLGDIKDENLQFQLPNDCQLIQIVNQNPAFLSLGKYFVIHKKWWDKIDSTTKAGLVLHELIYLKATVQNSSVVRRLTGLISSHQWNELAFFDVADFFISLNFVSIYQDGVYIDLEKPFSMGKEFFLEAYPDSEEKHDYNGQLIEFIPETKISFHSNGKVSCFFLDSKLVIKQLNQSITLMPNRTIPGYEEQNPDRPKGTCFHQNKSLKVARVVEQWFLYKEHRIKFRDSFGLNSQVEFYHDGSIKSIERFEGQLFIQNKKIDVCMGFDLIFSPEGKIISFWEL